MHILISNDDGIFAPGIRALALAAVEAGHRVSIFAPDSQRSAASHCINLEKPIQVKKVDFEGGLNAWSVSGTPADCVRVGIHLTKDDPVDCVISGVNNGPNRGAAILYSGTVGAAMEGSLCGKPALAVSLSKYNGTEFMPSARLGVKTMEWAMDYPLPIGEIYNLNVPDGEDILGVKAASVSHEFICIPNYRMLEDGSYIVSHTPNVVEDTDENCDLLLNNAGYASLSVLSWNLQADTPVPDLGGLKVK